VSPEPPPAAGGFQERWKAMKKLPGAMLIVWQAGSGVVAGGFLLRVVAAVIPLAMLAVSKKIIDAIVVSNFQPGSLCAGFWRLVLVEFALAMMASILLRAIDYCDSVLADRFTRHVSVRVIDHASCLDLSHYEDPVFYDKLERAKVQATDCLGMVQAVGRILQQVIIAITLSASIFVFSPWLLLVLTVCLVPAFLGESHFALVGYSLNFRQTPVRRQLDYLRNLGASKEAAKELKLFGLRSFLVGRYSALSDKIFDQNVGLAKRRLIAGSLLSLLSTAGYYAAYTYVIYRTITGGLSLGTLTFLTGAIAGASTSIQSIFSQVSCVADQALFVTNLLDFFAMHPAVQSKPAALPAPRPIRKGFEFDSVSFAYPGSSKLVLHSLDFRIEPGQRVALVGSNGQGKTTIVKLLTRLYDPSYGRILLDGVDLREYRLEDLYHEIGVIFQDFMRYEMTAQENIAIGRIEEVNRLSSIQLAASKSLADEVIGRLPGGYNQMLGRRFEGGIDLSGGEWQKLALARAYLRDAQVFVLDEPNASLDAIAEYDVFQRFASLTSGKMALLISHRFSTVRMADTILVLADGQIVEEGAHVELVSRGGVYSEMFELQASSYR
jgi:ATP-binding cassette subfamily B protein